MGDAPIPMLLWCPKCNEQHIDAPSEGWDNPPHRSHLCHACGCIWRPADVATTGVADIKTAGDADTWGRTGGDSLLPSLGKRLAACLAERDEAQRFLDGWHRQCQTIATILELPPASDETAGRVRNKFESLLAERDAASARVGEMREALAIAHCRVINHEARFEEIRDFVSEKLGTSWECDRCHYHTYHAQATECADCGEDMPFEHVIAFKLHASATDVPELIRETAGEMGFDPDGPEVAHAIARTPLGSARARLARGEGE